MFAFDADCSDCRFLRLDDEYQGKFYCEKKRDYVSARARRCNMAAEVMGRCTSDKNRARDISKRKGYFIITSITNILGLDEENQYLNTFSYLKDEILPNVGKNQEFLDIYEIDGPLLSNLLDSDEQRVQYADYLVSCYLNRFVSLVISEDIDSALSLYENMMIDMKKRYGLLKEYDNDQKLELLCE